MKNEKTVQSLEATIEFQQTRIKDLEAQLEFERNAHAQTQEAYTDEYIMRRQLERETGLKGRLLKGNSLL